MSLNIDMKCLWDCSGVAQTLNVKLLYELNIDIEYASYFPNDISYIVRFYKKECMKIPHNIFDLDTELAMSKTLVSYQ